MIDFMSKIRFPVAVTSQEQAQLEQWESAHGTPQQVALRCRIVLCAIDGQQNKAIADRLKVSRPTVNLWRVSGHFKMHHLWSLQSAPPWTRFF